MFHVKHEWFCFFNKLLFLLYLWVIYGVIGYGLDIPL